MKSKKALANFVLGVVLFGFAAAAAFGASTDTPEVAYAKIGLAFRAERYGASASIVRDGQIEAEPSMGPEA